MFGWIFSQVIFSLRGDNGKGISTPPAGTDAEKPPSSQPPNRQTERSHSPGAEEPENYSNIASIC